MPQPADGARRAALLDALIGVFSGGGIGGRSLREVAHAAGTSHRMLLHYFGSREELLLAIVEEVEHRQAAMLTHLPTDPADYFLAMWNDLRRPEVRPLERLFFECYARAAQGEAPFTRLLPGAVDGWLDDVDDAAPLPTDRPLTRLGLAVTRGLLLDLVATGDEAGVDAAASRFADLLRAVEPRRRRSAAPAASRDVP